MKNILLTEKFFAMQGEGYHIGTPSIFVRTFGCSLRCQGFGRHHSESEQYIDVVDFSKIKTLEDTPILDWGCDTPAAIWPEAKHLQEKYNKEELWDEIKNMLPNESWTNEIGNDTHLIFTGGEPLLPGWQKFYTEFFRYLIELDKLPKHISFETNCTQKLLPFFQDVLQIDIRSKGTKITFCCSPKLSTSGEKIEDRVKLDVLRQYAKSYFSDICFLKFVIENEQQIEEAKEIINNLGIKVDACYLMPVGGTNEVYMRNKIIVHDLAIKHGFRFSPRLQCEVSENKWGT